MAGDPSPRTTPDARYLVVRGRLWRATNPALDAGDRQRLVNQLMRGRRAVGAAMRSKNTGELRKAREQVDAAKRALGERGPVWWTDGAPDLNQHMAHNTPYATWYATDDK